ncbi:MAG: 30S ribosomal protein S1 [Alphaproteobacteria bacterium MarineAlpha6_Bin6]|nr:MAG: 30S ribosomal protein S1 [Alphaproteobacteria bacterium MarineAlpha6_Bin6]PPR33613.1 MAG: 30S ribosomal protein S1 [Alphaproteobacteria bacterium MarineAlpha6_Bin5]|tara:strand:+ start:2641 stop:4350 length:1710 start_codon:yes stop_codon:yes gene_type:complete
MTENTENFEALLDQSLKKIKNFEGKVVNGKVISIDHNHALIDVGLKSEGRVSMDELRFCDKEKEIKVGDKIDVFVERVEDKNGEAVLSREKAKKEVAFDAFNQLLEKDKAIDGKIYGKVKGGYTVDIDGVITFLPGSQVDIKPVKDINHLIEQKLSFKVLKIDKERGNIVISRKAFLEESFKKNLKDVKKNLKEGGTVEGIVKNITDYGAFVDLGTTDGLIHLTDISWKRINHPSDYLKIGQTVKVKVLKFSPESSKISLGIKQLTKDPWKDIEKKYKEGKNYIGKVSKITDYGAFIELEDGIEGLIHVSEMTWDKKKNNPSEIVKMGDKVDVMVLELDLDKRKLSFRMKKESSNPWKEYSKKYKKGKIIECKVGNIAEYGIFVNLEENLDGMVHISDIDWEWDNKSTSKFKTGDVIKSIILDVNEEKQRISLGIKQLDDSPFKEKIKDIKIKDVITCSVIHIKDTGVKVKLDNNLDGFIDKKNLSMDESEQNPRRYAANEKLDAMIKAIDKENKIIVLSIKDIESKEQKKIKKEFGSLDSGATLGKILGEKKNSKKKTVKSKKGKKNE